MIQVKNPMRFQDTRFWKNYQQYEQVFKNSSMRSTVDAIAYWKLLNEFKFDTFLEIGTYQGLTTGLFFESNNNATVVGIDTVNRLELFYKNYTEFQNQFTFINQRSQDVDISNQLYDFILVDGDHSYKGAKIDIVNSLACLKTTSVLAIDDFKMPGVAQAIKYLYNLNTDWVPFLQAEQTQFWHHRSVDRAEFLDSLITDPIKNFIFVENIVDEFDNTICSLKTLPMFTDLTEYFDMALKHYNI
jgi:predicted O-methyltransferase YrrM